MSLPWPLTEAAEGTLRVAFATHGRTHVDQHFGAAEGFVLYTLDAERARLAGVLEFAAGAPQSNEHKLALRIAALGGADAVYCLAAGTSAIRQLLEAGIHPVRLDEPTKIVKLIHTLHNAIRYGGVNWVDRCMRRASSERLDRVVDTRWEE